MLNHYFKLSLHLSVFLYILLFFLSCKAFAVKNICIVTSKSIGPYNEAADGFRDVLNKAGYTKSNINIIFYDMKGKPENMSRIISEIEWKKPDVIYTIGTPATKDIIEKIENTPIIFSMVLNSKSYEFISKNRIGGVSIDIYIKDQIEIIKKVMPNIKKLGVLYDPVNNKDLIKQIEKLVFESGISIISQAVANNNEVSTAFRSISGKIDMLWLLPDTTVITSENVDYLINAATLLRIPVYGLSKAYVDKGALVALYVDYYDIGVQAGEIANTYFRHGKISFQNPDRIFSAINLKTARALNLKIPEFIVKSASYKVE